MKENRDARSNAGGTALTWASQRGHIEIVRVLIEQGADVNARSDYHGGTALIMASCNEHREIVQLLRRAGACAHVQ